MSLVLGCVYMRPALLQSQAHPCVCTHLLLSDTQSILHGGTDVLFIEANMHCFFRQKKANWRTEDKLIGLLNGCVYRCFLSKDLITSSRNKNVYHVNVFWLASVIIHRNYVVFFYLILIHRSSLILIHRNT